LNYLFIILARFRLNYYRTEKSEFRKKVRRAFFHILVVRNVTERNCV